MSGGVSIFQGQEPGLPPAGSRLHLVGVSGAGMAPLALSLAAAGWKITGEDRHWPGETRRWLVAGGVTCTDDGELPDDSVAIICSSAVKPAHPTVAAAIARGLPILRRGLALAALVRGRSLIAVAGSHGKTTTTAMLATALDAAGIRADYLLGGLFGDGTTPPARWRGEGPVVAEIDESDGTIEAFAPDILVCVNVDWDHPDHYCEAEDLEKTFAALARRTKSAVFYNAGCERSRRIFRFDGATEELLGMSAGVLSAICISFGAAGDFALTGSEAHEGGAGQTLRLGGRFRQGSARLAADGIFNAQNAAAALAVAAWLGARDVSSLLIRFPGVRRRQAPLPARPGITIIEDYAHHPVEIEALLKAMRGRRPERLVVVFQPHRFSRTARFKAAFARALALGDRVFLLPVYSAGEVRMEGGASEDVFAELHALSNHPPVRLVADAAAAAERIAAEAREGDLLVFVGAGDIDGVARSVSLLLSAEPEVAATSREALLRALDRRLSSETLVRAGEPLGPKTTIRVGGSAEVYVEPANTADLQSLLVAARTAGLPVHLLGRGSNLIVPDDGVQGMVVRLQHPHWRRFINLGPGRYWAGAGLRLKELCGLACKAGEAGFEFLEGIPGTVGGALRMNAGAMGGWMFDLVEQLHFLTLDGELCIRRREELRTG
ncbi:MAG: FAD-binding protein, partial [Opitutaceae bacterium]